MLYFIPILVVMFVECFMLVKWVPAYFKHGIPVYSKRFIGKKSVLAEINVAHLNSVAVSFVLSFTTPLIFKKIAEGQWALRQYSSNSRIMRGKLTVNTDTSNVSIVGYISWSILLMTAIAILMLIQSKNLFFITVIVIGTTLCYFLEKTMYDRLVNYLSEEE